MIQSCDEYALQRQLLYCSAAAANLLSGNRRGGSSPASVISMQDARSQRTEFWPISLIRQGSGLLFLGPPA